MTKSSSLILAIPLEKLYLYGIIWAAKIEVEVVVVVVAVVVSSSSAGLFNNKINLNWLNDSFALHKVKCKNLFLT